MAIAFTSDSQDVKSNDNNLTPEYKSRELHLAAGYFCFNHKYKKVRSFGFNAGFSKHFNRSFAAVVDIGYYSHRGNISNGREISRFLNVCAGVNYLPFNGRLNFSTHGIVGVSRYIQNTTSFNGSFSVARYSVNFNIGAALHWRLSPSLEILLLRADYAPTFYFATIQQNIGLSMGIAYKTN